MLCHIIDASFILEYSLNPAYPTFFSITSLTIKLSFAFTNHNHKLPFQTAPNYTTVQITLKKNQLLVTRNKMD